MINQKIYFKDNIIIRMCTYNELEESVHIYILSTYNYIVNRLGGYNRLKTWIKPLQFSLSTEKNEVNQE